MPPRPRLRADAQRNYDRLLAAAESALDERGASASLDDIAKAAGVGNATLYRHFPTREKLIEAVYDQRIQALCDAAADLAAAHPPDEALAAWLHAVATHVNASRTLADAFDAAYQGPEGTEPPQVTAWHRAVRRAADPLVLAARTAGRVRTDLDSTELLALTAAVARAGDPQQAHRFLDVLMDGITPRPEPAS
ncbi:TetR/AcrR family transcriptional regulator [Yinghuangia soli]|uniref:TetR/AcrR family transcriptional regulator n=1 Tax=Yinghuangia soli TaxID=2908204 RepID=A0AA41QAW6_9ACTN|nr:TetR/AcrR family transcriptional regulator [Yinghuangia soli]MCF2533559.1 TetR/AcrR family transcriptional regulator [Yinghuangia soli]